MFHCSDRALGFELEDSRTCYDEIGHVSLRWIVLDSAFDSVETSSDIEFFRGKTPKARIDKAYRRAYKILSDWFNDVNAVNARKLVKFFNIK